MSLKTQRFYDFGNFRLDLAEKVLLREGKFIPITPKVFETLCVLIEKAGRLVEKDELMREIWQDRFVEESNLTFNIKMLRKALGDDAANPTFIETVPRRGYRFIADVKKVFPAENSPPESVKTFAPQKSFFLPLAVFGILLFCAVVFGLWMARTKIFAEKSGVPVLSAMFHSEKISNSGKVRFAAISPDGKLVAYANETNGKYGVWLKRLETSDNVQIVAPSDGIYSGFVFTHDGQSIYFVRKPIAGSSISGIYRISIFGGIPEKISEHTEGWISLSPDDRQISFVRCRYQEGDFCSLLVADADGKNERKILTRPRPVRISDNQFSPDGKLIAFADGHSRNGASDFRLMQIDLTNGEENAISPKTFFDIKNLKWLPSGGELLLTAMENLDGKVKIWQISPATGEAKPLTKDAANYSMISLNKDASRMIATQLNNNFQLYFSANGETKILTAAREATFAPDGKIVYSTDDGDIWTITREGGEQHQLTNNSFKDFSPRVSPDNRFIFFASNRTGANQVWRMNIDGSNQTQLTKTEGGYPRFVSPDGRWVYYESGLTQTVWKVSTEGGEEIQVSEQKIYSPAFSSDGNYAAYFFRTPDVKIGVINLVDKRQIKTLGYGSGKVIPVKIAWSPVGNQTLNFIIDDNAKNSLWQQSLDDAQPLFIADLGDKEIEDFALAPDGNGFAYTRGEWLYDAVLIDGLK